MKICIDAGHGSGDPGAIGNGLEEAELTGKIVDFLIQRLQDFEVEVLRVPRYRDLYDRCHYANINNADFFLSIHINSAGGTGFESFIHPNASVKTRNIQNSIHHHLANWFKSQGFSDRGKKEANFAVLRETKMPAVLLECLFIDHRQDADFLRNDNNLDKLANEIAWVLAKIFNLKKKVDYEKQIKELKDRLNQAEDLLQNISKSISQFLGTE